MSKLSQHIKRIHEVVQTWLRPGNNDLKEAIEKSVDDGFFSIEDIKHQIKHLKNSVTETSLMEWAEKSGLIYQSLKGKNVLCLHAGNLPLVGFQDVMAILLTGGNYFGKISKKDPYLLPAFLQHVNESGLRVTTEWSVDIHYFKSLKTDYVLFAGSESSVKDVKEKLSGLKIIDSKTPLLIRTAHFSIAWITNNAKQTMEDLTEAVFRYGGTGCRSAAIVVAPFSLNSEKCTFTDYVESFWLRNPQHKKPTPSLYHRYVYNKSIGVEQAWLDDFLIEEYETKPTEKYILHWIKGDKNDVGRLVNLFSKGLQSVYSNDMTFKNIGNRTIEPLSSAQTPPIWWNPDQIDTIEWLQNN